jgi:hypothetical protein
LQVTADSIKTIQARMATVKGAPQPVGVVVMLVIGQPVRRLEADGILVESIGVVAAFGHVAFCLEAVQAKHQVLPALIALLLKSWFFSA